MICCKGCCDDAMPFTSVNIRRNSNVSRAGKGAVYSYDAIGSHERSGYSVQASLSILLFFVL